MRGFRWQAGALAAVVAGALLAAPASADPRPPVPSELGPPTQGGSPPSAWAGNPDDAPSIDSPVDTFGRIAAGAHVGLRSYRYSTLYDNASTLDVYTPAGLRGPAPTVVLVHGGAWQTGDRIDLESQAVQMARQLHVVVASVNYRLATQAAWPAQREDVDAAVRFLRDGASDLKVDPHRVAILGSSAGGQIAAAVATEGEGRSRFRGLVTLSGLVNPELMAEQNPGFSDSVVPEKLLRCEPSDCPDRYQDATAVSALYVHDPPSLLFHSQDETPWDPTQAEQFVGASNAIDLPSILVVLPGADHGIQTWRTAWPMIKVWLGDRLGIRDAAA